MLHLQSHCRTLTVIPSSQPEVGVAQETQHTAAHTIHRTIHCATLIGKCKVLPGIVTILAQALPSTLAFCAIN